MEIIDTHTHLYLPELASDLDGVLHRAREAGVHRCITLGIDVATSRRAVALADQYDMIYAAVGIHPSESARATAADIDAIRELAKHPRVVAIGEIGMDFYWQDVPPEPQYRVFEAMLHIAREADLPVVIHSRNAVREIEWFVQELGITHLKGQMHCFEAEELDARFFLDLGMHISIAGNVAYKGFKYLPTVRAIPLNRLLLETDSPYLTPLPKRGQHNEPANIVYVAEKLASIKNIPLDTLITHTTQNARELFGV